MSKKSFSLPSLKQEIANNEQVVFAGNDDSITIDHSVEEESMKKITMSTLATTIVSVSSKDDERATTLHFFYQNDNEWQRATVSYLRTDKDVKFTGIDGEFSVVPVNGLEIPVTGIDRDSDDFVISGHMVTDEGPTSVKSLVEKIRKNRDEAERAFNALQDYIRI